MSFDRTDFALWLNDRFRENLREGYYPKEIQDWFKTAMRALGSVKQGQEFIAGFLLESIARTERLESLLAEGIPLKALRATANAELNRLGISKEWLSASRATLQTLYLARALERIHGPGAARVLMVLIDFERSEIGRSDDLMHWWDRQTFSGSSVRFSYLGFNLESLQRASRNGVWREPNERLEEPQSGYLDVD